MKTELQFQLLPMSSLPDHTTPTSSMQPGILCFEVPHGNPRARFRRSGSSAPQQAFVVKMLTVGWTIGLEVISQVEPLGFAFRTANQAQGGVRDQDVYRLVVLARGHTCEGG